MRIATIDDMLAALATLKDEMGGSSAVAIKDADTGWHMRISEVRRGKSCPERVLFVGGGYSEDEVFQDGGGA